MKQDIILSGVGGQGVLSVATIIAAGAIKQGLTVRQSEIHGMAQRGGEVLVHLRISDKSIESDLIPRKTADFILSMEPLESLRHIEYLAEGGMVITSINPVVNINNYPEEEFLLRQIQSLPQYRAIDAKGIAIKAGAAKSVNVVLAGAASKKISIDTRLLEEAIRDQFIAKGKKIVDINLKAFHLGREAECPISFN